GGNEEENLIFVCFSCHSDVHTKVPFARRFSEEELKGHRDALVKAVADGRLPTTDTDDADEVMLALSRGQPAALEPHASLSPEATAILLRAVNTDGPQQGVVIAALTCDGLSRTACDKGRERRHDA